MLDALRSPDAATRSGAAEVLGLIGAQGAVSVLLDALTCDIDCRVRSNAAEALGKIRDERAIPALLAALAGDSDVREAASKSLGRFGMPALPGLVQALDSLDSGVRYWAVRALGDLGDPKSIPALERIMNDEDRTVSNSAAKAIKKIGRVTATGLGDG